MIDRIIHELKALCLSQKIILDYPQLPAKVNEVNLSYYHPELKQKDNLNINNLGDFLSKEVVSYLLETKGLSLGQRVSQTKHLYAIGSILLMGYQNAVIWGSGFPYEPSLLCAFFHRSIFRKLDVRCVRGPLTKNTLKRLGHSCSNDYGDPAVLMPKIYAPNTIKTTDYIFIPHFAMEQKYKYVIPTEKIVSMNTTDYKKVIDKIVSAEKVISSSLHGIILAESYGVPAIFYRDRGQKFDYKYQDWYLSTGRKNYKIIDDIKEAINFKENFVPDLSKMQETLINTFPYDLWDK